MRSCAIGVRLKRGSTRSASHVSGFSYAMRAMFWRETDQVFHDAMCDLFLELYELSDVGQWLGAVRS
jgi:hypothetical protein